MRDLIILLLLVLVVSVVVRPPTWNLAAMRTELGRRSRAGLARARSALRRPRGHRPHPGPLDTVDALNDTIAASVFALGVWDRGLHQLRLPEAIVIRAHPIDVVALRQDLPAVEDAVTRCIRSRHSDAALLRIDRLLRDDLLTAGRPTVEAAPVRTPPAPTAPLAEQRTRTGAQLAERHLIAAPGRTEHLMAEQSPPGRPSARLVVLGTSGTALDVPADGGALGRDALHCAIVIDTPTVSRRHAQLTPTEDGFLVQDLGSANGLAINAQRTGEGLLRHGDLLGLGKKVRLRLEIRDEG